MESSGIAGRLADRGRATSRLHGARVSLQQRAHRAALLILLLAGSAAAGEIDFDPSITREEFRRFSAVVGQAIYATPVEPAEGGSLFGFDIGVAVTAIEIDQTAEYWLRSVEGDITTDGYLLVPKIVATKGFGRLNLSASYAAIPEADVAVWGATVDLGVLEGGLTRPTLGLRGTWADLRGVDALDLTTLGIEAYVSKRFGPLTPYAGVGMTRVDSEALIPATAVTDELLLSDELDDERITVGVRLSLLLWKIVVEATEASERTYAAKFSFSL